MWNTWCVGFGVVVFSLFFFSMGISIVFFWYCLIYPFEFNPAPVTPGFVLLRLSYIWISFKEFKEAKGNLTMIDMVLHSISGSDRFSCLVTILFDLFTCFEVLLKLVIETHFSSHWKKIPTSLWLKYACSEEQRKPCLCSQFVLIEKPQL